MQTNDVSLIFLHKLLQVIDLYFKSWCNTASELPKSIVEETARATKHPANSIKSHAKAWKNRAIWRSGPLTGVKLAYRVVDDEVSAAPGVHATPSRGAWTERRPPRLTPGSFRGRGSSPARFASQIGSKIEARGNQFTGVASCLFEG